MNDSKRHSIADDFASVREAMSRYNGHGSYEERRLWFEEGTLALKRIEEQLEAAERHGDEMRQLAHRQGETIYDLTVQVAQARRLAEAVRVLDVMLNEPAAEGLMTAEDYRSYVGGAWLGVHESLELFASNPASTPSSRESGRALIDDANRWEAAYRRERDAFVRRDAEWLGVTVDRYLRFHHVEPCGCREDGCEGWQVISKVTGRGRGEA